MFTKGTVKISKGSQVEGGYNILDGLRMWREATAYFRGSRTLAGGGGADVCVLSDSTLVTGGAFSLSDNAINRLRQDLQYTFNPVDVQDGGYGFLPIMSNPDGISLHWSGFGNSGMHQAGAVAVWPAYGPSFYIGEAGASKGICGRHMRSSTALAGTNQSCAWFFAAGAAYQNNKQVSEAAQITVAKQAQVVYQTNPADGVFRWGWGDFNGGVIPYAGATFYPDYPGEIDANAFQEDVDCDAAEAVGKRSGLADVTSKPAATTWIQINQKETLNPINIEGLLLYKDDYDMGVRVHQLGMGGATSSTYNNAVTLAGLARFGTPAGAIPGQNSTNAKLWIICLGVNDNSSGGAPVNSVATMKANLVTLVESLQAHTSRPSILFVIPPAWSNANFLARWPDYVAAILAICDSHNCAALNLYKATGSQARATAFPAAFDQGDGIHFSSIGHDWLSGLIRGAVMVGL